MVDVVLEASVDRGEVAESTLEAGCPLAIVLALVVIATVLETVFEPMSVVLAGVGTKYSLTNSLTALGPPSVAIMDNSSANMLARTLCAPVGSAVKKAGVAVGMKSSLLMPATQDSREDAKGGFVATGPKADMTAGSARIEEKRVLKSDRRSDLE